MKIDNADDQYYSWGEYLADIYNRQTNKCNAAAQTNNSFIFYLRKLGYFGSEWLK